LSKEEIEIEYTPIKRVKIIDYIHLSLEELAKRAQVMMQLGQPTLLDWTEGIAFYIVPMPFDSDYLAEKYLEGELVLQSIVYALMPNYSPKIKVKAYDVYILNQTPSKLLSAIARWIKTHTENGNH